MGARQRGERGGMPTTTTRSRLADASSWCLALSALAALLLVCSLGETTEAVTVRGASLSARWRPCEEIYVVAEGETLHGISDRCGDPYILERNPHVHDPDDVFPGLVLRITPSSPRPSVPASPP
ncbi:uncharacterized protein LOC123447428 [Hordeum vulgare subsp. vulgare]|uniref:LysM domain-containing protein n=1 Tax=Hordeum vulgare subsp. vulgare TaxID=112509 RepID=A0A8I6X645_HORVV|nr:uncharacterized protein LOC123447428 [Hordeum vulgare subsp. vulgare]